MTISNIKMKCTPNTPESIMTNECFGKYLIRAEIRYLSCIIKTEIYESISILR